MAIPIECEACHRSYKVDDKLAGKKVKCKGCGATISVPGTENPADDALRECLSCGSSLAPGNRVCPKCGFNVQTGQKEALLLESETEELKARKKRRWVRQPGSPLLETLDQYLKLLLVLALLAGIAMTVVHILRTATDGFTFPAILPTILVLAAIGGIMAPLTALAVNLTLRAMKIATRDDTYVRVALCLLLPYSVAMLAGWPEMGPIWNWIPDMGWPAAILLLAYFFRAEALEWVASVIAAIAAMALSLILVNLLGGAVNDMAGGNGLYADMLPRGLWTALAKGHSPLPPETRKKTPDTTPVTIVSTTSAPAATTGGTIAGIPPDVTPTTTQMATTTSATLSGGTSTTTTRPLDPPKMTSPFFAGVTDDPALRDAVAIVAPVAPADWMLAIKHTETTSEVDRWCLNPLEKKEHLSRPFVARKAPQFALSPKGDAVATLVFFPRRELEVIAYDNKTRKSVILDLPANVPEGIIQATPALLGILDPARFFLRWDNSGNSALQIFAAPASTTGTPPWRTVPLGATAETTTALLSPNGRIAAIFGRNQILFASVDGTTPPKPILVASDPDVRLLGMAFSSDSSQIAIYAAIADLPTVLAYQLKNGESVFISLLSQTPLDKAAEVMPHALLWLPGAQACLINGNDLVHAATGKKIASLGLSGVADVQLVGPSTLALTFKTPTGAPHTILAKLDDEKIRAAAKNP